jgi:hypothetical protein
MSDDYGELVWPRFFGPSIEYKRSASKYVTIALAVTGTGLFLATGVLLLSGTGISGQATLNILIALGIPVLYWMMHRRARTSMEYEFMQRRGELDWDLYENGFLTREYDAEMPGRVRTAFVGFGRFSRAYVNIDRQNARLVWELAKASARKARKATSEEDVGSDFQWDDNAEEQVAGNIWLVDRETGRADLRLDRVRLADISRFETLLRQKVKEVE